MSPASGKAALPMAAIRFASGVHLLSLPNLPEQRRNYCSDTDRQSQDSRVDQRNVAGNDPTLLEPPHPLVDGGRTQASRPAQFRKGRTAVPTQYVHDLAVSGIKACGPNAEVLVLRLAWRAVHREPSTGAAVVPSGCPDTEIVWSEPVAAGVTGAQGERWRATAPSVWTAISKPLHRSTRFPDCPARKASSGTVRRRIAAAFRARRARTAGSRVSQPPT